MTGKTVPLDERLHNYLLDVSLRESPLLRELREHTQAGPMAQMQIAPEQGQLMALLARLVDAKLALEIGVFTGYSALCVAKVLPKDGLLVACDINEEWTATAREFWRRGEVEHKVDLRLAPAVDTLDVLIQDGMSERFDFVFIDADKTHYAEYYERSLQLVREGGLIVVDNVLWSGRVADPEADDEDTKAIRAFNKKLHEDQRVDISILPLADGITLARKRAQET